MRTNISRRLAAAVIVPVALVGLAACNDDDKSADSDKPNESTSQEVTEQGDATEGADTTNSSVQQVSNDDFAKIVADGTEQATTAKLTMEITAGGVVTTAEGALDTRGKQPATQLSMTVPGAANGGKMEVILVDGVIYMAMPVEGQSGYMKIDPAANPELAEQMGGMDSLDLASLTKTFSEGLEDVETVGTEDIDGVSTTHYKVSVNTDGATGMLSGLQGAEGVEVPETLAFDVWLDDEGRFVQMEADLDEQGSMKLHVFDYGTDVSIKAPPADQVQDMSDLMGSTSAPTE